MDQGPKNTPKIVIIGAGLSGILMGIQLLKEGIKTFEILEMGESVGGTWRDNTYPGLCCDVPAHAYSYTFEPNWKWRGVHAEGHEIREYFEHCADKYGLKPFLHFNTRVNRITREDDAWTIATEDGLLRRADIVVSCMGWLVYPKSPEIMGLENFTGQYFHSACWDHTVSLDGKRVGVIGTGSSAIQITSALVERVAHFSLFQRTPAWILQNAQKPRPDWLRGLQRKIPILAKLSGRIQQLNMERNFSSALSGNRKTMSVLESVCQNNLDKVRDPELKKKLTPNYSVGCKRIVISNTFYDSIQQPNAQLVTDNIQHIEPGGVRTRDGRLHELDVMIFATGFHTMDYIRNMTITGVQGQNLRDVWADGAQALRSICIAGFPNLFMIGGPHSPLGNFPITGLSETQVRYVMHFIRMIKRGKVRTVTAKLSAQDQYNEMLRNALKGTVWDSGCSSWYLNAKGQPAIYPFTPKQYRKDLCRPDFTEFEMSSS
ncbi:NAD(P)/FAD-dependent oxidoreductase [Mycoavidus sp. SF9855]|uniref:flavin-containing monooxygenase n=1 Tax=Mycoavidus sp. SF9855 TaxID=2968475 RepID=UPI00211CB511|nr:NAD(P)/FAD-dependent oxidoreductase [Mycoavidus sp. SF9855]UUM21173.1 NAD(P)/FAD-dependent oxidoreductase [Mycoavidus sp. SF9855]